MKEDTDPGDHPFPPDATDAQKTETINDRIAQTDVEMRRVGIGASEGRNILNERYSKKSRHQLSTDEIGDFLRYLKSLPSKEKSPF